MSLLFFGGSILTMTKDGAYAQALLEEKGKIAYVGSLEKARSLAGRQVETVDLAGRALLPAFLDAHSHLTMAARFSTGVDLSGCTDIPQITQALRVFLCAHPTGVEGALLGINYDDNFLKESRHPTREALDAVSREIPILILHISSHMGVANTRLLDILGYTSQTPDPPGGKLGRDAQGSLTGYLEETAAYVPALLEVFRRTKQDMPALLDRAQEEYLCYGITTIQEGAADIETARLLKAQAEAGRLKADVVCYLRADSAEDAEAAFRELSPGNGYHNRFRLGGYKAILDGSPQGRTAWLTQPYLGTDCFGNPQLSDEKLFRICAQAIQNRRQLLTHCNGDAAAEQFLTQYRRAWEQCSKGPSLRPVMIHSQILREDQLARMGALGMIPSFFIGHLWYWGDVHLKNLGRERGSYISPAATARKLDLPYTFHQDTPVTKPDMLHSVWCAVCRQSRSGKILAPELRLSTYDALLGITANAAFAYGEEQIKGTLEPGKLADLVILDQDPLKAPPEALRDIQILATYKEGIPLFQK